MANAKKCDRCGAFYEKNKNHKMNGLYIGGVALKSGVGSYIVDYDLCDDCIEALKKFLSESNVSDKK